MARNTSNTASEKSDGPKADRKIVQLTQRVGSHLVGETFTPERAEELGLKAEQLRELSG